MIPRDELVAAAQAWSTLSFVITGVVALLAVAMLMITVVVSYKKRHKVFASVVLVVWSAGFVFTAKSCIRTHYAPSSITAEDSP